MSKLKKGLKIFILVTIIFLIVVIAFISPITEYLVEKYDKKYTGRQIEMDWAYVNPFTGYLYFSNFRIYELESDSIFFSANGLSANIGMYPLFFKNYEISQLTLHKPKGVIIQNKKQFNFNSLIEQFSSKDESKKNKEPLHLSILNVKINNGELYYREMVTPINYFIKNLTIESDGYRWDADTIPVKFSFLSGIGSGAMNGNFTINSKNKNYTLAILIHKFDLNIVGQYIKDLSNYGIFKAFLDADFKSKGSLIDRENVTHSGNIKISDFHFGKTQKEDFASFDELVIAIHEVSPRKFIYFFDSVSVSHPYFKYEKYDHLDNVQTMFGKKGANIKAANADDEKFNLVIEIAQYIKVLSKNFLRSNYRVDRVGIYKGEIKFDDYSLNEKFSIELDPFTFTADSVDKAHKRVNFNLASEIKPYGDVTLDISINPKDSSDFDLTYHFQKIPAAMFNPYLIKYSSFPLDRGTIEVKGSWNVNNGKIKSDNHLVIIDPRIGDRLRNKNSNWLPMRFIMFFVRERGNVIDYEVPIEGNLNDPNFNFRDVIIDILQNIFIKPVTTPYRVEVKNVETEIEKALAVKWPMNSSLLTSKQESFLKKMVVFLEENPLVSINVHPNNYTPKEKEYILLFEAKKLYFIKYNNEKNHSLTKNDSLAIEKMSIKDSLFTNYLNAKVNDSMIFTVQEKCSILVGTNKIDAIFNTLTLQREKVFMQYFIQNKVNKQVNFLSAKTVVPFNGYSFFKIEYEGEFPDYLIQAHKKMNELNNEAPRDKFRKQRQKNRIIQ